jgi:hypothetical protein
MWVLFNEAKEVYFWQVGLDNGSELCRGVQECQSLQA